MREMWERARACLALAQECYGKSNGEDEFMDIAGVMCYHATDYTIGYMLLTRNHMLVHGESLALRVDYAKHYGFTWSILLPIEQYSAMLELWGTNTKSGAGLEGQSYIVRNVLKHVTDLVNYASQVY